MKLTAEAVCYQTLVEPFDPIAKHAVSCEAGVIFFFGGGGNSKV